MGIGPLIAWRKTSVRSLVRTLAWPIAVTIACGVALVAVGAGSSKPGLIAYTFSSFVLATIVLELVRGTRATGSLFELIARNRRRYGGYVVHAAVVLLAIGVAGSSAYGANVERRLALGQSTTVHGYTLTNRGVVTRTTSRAVETRAVLDVRGRYTGRIESGTNQFFNPPEPAEEVAIKTSWSRAEDLYVIAEEAHPKTQVVLLHVLVKPLVNLIWVAGIVFLVGSAVALWPDAREQRRLAARLAPARA
jgi:cytochrome c-type biogenesis protein CcmF